MKYTIGYLEIEDLLEDAKDLLGDEFVLKEFHKFFLSTGPAPFDVIRSRMEDWASAQAKK